MANVLKLKNGKTMVLGEKKRNGNKREVIIGMDAKVTFKEGGARRFTDINLAEKWVSSHNFESVSSFSAWLDECSR